MITTVSTLIITLVEVSVLFGISGGAPVIMRLTCTTIVSAIRSHAAQLGTPSTSYCERISAVSSAASVSGAVATIDRTAFAESSTAHKSSRRVRRSSTVVIPLARASMLSMSTPSSLRSYAIRARSTNATDRSFAYFRTGSDSDAAADMYSRRTVSKRARSRVYS